MGVKMDGGIATSAFQDQGLAPPPRGDASCQLLDNGPRFQVRRHRIEPGAALPSCHHLHRSEHWTVVQGTARVTRGEGSALFAEGQSFAVPLGQTHRVENPGRIPLILVEVCTGSYFGEDDTIADAPTGP